MALFQTVNPVNMILQRIGPFAFALFAGAVTATVQAAESDVVGWEGARWGMNEREIRDAFSSKLLVPLAGEQPGETVLSIPGYVFLGCPFDVYFCFAGAHGLVQVTPAPEGFYFQASGSLVTLTAAGYNYNMDWTGPAHAGSRLKLTDALEGAVRNAI